MKVQQSLTVPRPVRGLMLMKSQIISRKEVVYSIPIGALSDIRRRTALALQGRDLHNRLLRSIRSALCEHSQIIQAVSDMAVQRWRLHCLV